MQKIFLYLHFFVTQSQKWRKNNSIIKKKSDGLCVNHVAY